MSNPTSVCRKKIVKNVTTCKQDHDELIMNQLIEDDSLRKKNLQGFSPITLKFTVITKQQQRR